MSDIQKSYKAGLSVGVLMTDAECIRFANGLVAAINDTVLAKPQFTANASRMSIVTFMDILAEKGMVAIVGINGTPIISNL